MAAMRAMASTSPLGSPVVPPRAPSLPRGGAARGFAHTSARVAGDRRTSATATASRAVSSLAPTSTIRTRPSGSVWVRWAAGAARRGGFRWSRGMTGVRVRAGADLIPARRFPGGASPGGAWPSGPCAPRLLRAPSANTIAFFVDSPSSAESPVEPELPTVPPAGGFFARFSELQIQLGVWALGLLIYVPFAGTYGLFDPWETHYGEVARQMA